MIFLVEAEGLDEATGAVVPLRFAGPQPFYTRPTDDPANAAFLSRLNDPGNFERHLFGKGRTYGDSEIGAGEIRLNNTEGDLDFVADLVFAGRPLRIWTVERPTSSWSTRKAVLKGTAEQATSVGREITIRLRDVLDLLREPVQTAVYLGTTTAGGSAVAEGNTDLKDVKRPWLAGRALAISPILVDQFDQVYDITAGPLHAVENVRGNGTKLTPTQDYPDLASLKAASISGAQFATSRAIGKIRTAVRIGGPLTLDASEGATPADRSAARVARRLIGSVGTVAEEDFEALHAANPAEAGIWLAPGETTRLAAASSILSAVGGFLSGDLFGVYRTGRLLLAEGASTATIGRSRLIDKGEGFSRLPTNDPGDGVPAWRVTVRFARAYTTFSEADLKDVETDDTFRTFAGQEFRQVVEEDAAVKARHPKAIELVFTLPLLEEAAARAECRRLLAFFRVPRRLFTVTAPSRTVADVDLNHCVTLQLPRFGLDAGRLLRVIGLTPTLKARITTLDLLE